MFGKPSELHDRLSAVLGLDDLTATQTRLATRRKQLESTAKGATKTRTALVDALAELTGDARADAARVALSARNPDLDAVEAVVTGVAEPDGGGALARLRTLAQLDAPDVVEVGAAVDALRAAADALDAVTGTDAERARRLADLLTGALDHHDAHPATVADCPVCGRTGALDAEWRRATTEEIATLRAEAATAESARAAGSTAERRARALVTEAPAAVTAPPPGDLGVDLDALAGTWQAWAAIDVLSAGNLRALARPPRRPRRRLARVLERVAASRQVVVLTHDDRLPSAVRRLGIAARILQVHRRPGSIVDITAAGDPAAQALRDARAVASDTGAPAEVVGKVVPGLCRIAVEAACTDAARRRLLAAGAEHADVDDALTEARRLTQKAALALFGDADRAGDVLGRLNGLGRDHADTFQALNKGAHGELTGSAEDTVRDAERLVVAVVEASR